MSKVAYELREDHAGTVTQNIDGQDVEVPRFLGGLITVAPGGELNVADALEEGNGVIVVDDRDAGHIAALDAYPALKRTKAPAGAEAITGTSSGYDAKSRDDLRDEAKRRGLPASGTKGELVEALEQHDAGDTGDTDDGEEG